MHEGTSIAVVVVILNFVEEEEIMHLVILAKSDFLSHCYYETGEQLRIHLLAFFCTFSTDPYDIIATM